MCLTCPHETNPYTFDKPGSTLLNIEKSDKCLYHSASFSLNADFYALECLGDRTPITHIKSSNKDSVEC